MRMFLAAILLGVSKGGNTVCPVRLPQLQAMAALYCSAAIARAGITSPRSKPRELHGSLIVCKVYLLLRQNGASCLLALPL